MRCCRTHSMRTWQLVHLNGAVPSAEAISSVWGAFRNNGNPRNLLNCSTLLPAGSCSGNHLHLRFTSVRCCGAHLHGHSSLFS